MSQIFLDMIDYAFSNKLHSFSLYLRDLLSTNQHKSISFIIAPSLTQTHLLFFLSLELDNRE